MQFEIIVELKKEVLDAEGRAIKESLLRLGYDELKDVKVSKRFVIDLNSDRSKAEEIANKYLANPISEKFSIREL